MMNPLILVILFSANLLTLVVALSVLMLAVWQQSGDAIGRAVVQFLAATSLYNLAVLLLTTGTILAYPPDLSLFTANLVIAAFALCTISTFSLVITLAGMMKQAWQVIARAGVVAVLLWQWPLWTGGFFTRAAPYSRMAEYTPVGAFAAAGGLVFVVMTLAAIWVYRRRIGHPAILAGLVLLLGADALTLFSPLLREVGFPSLVSIVVSAVLGYNLMRMRLFGPLLVQNAQLGAMREISRTIARSDDKGVLLNTVAEQARRTLRTGLTLILTRSGDATLIVCAQAGGTISLLQRTEPIGDGLSGRVFETQQAMRLANYRTWDGRLPAFADMPFYASLSVPLIYNYDVVGILTVHELEAGRLFDDQDQAVLEMLAPQAAVAIVNAALRQRINALQQYNGADSRADSHPAPKT
jgi:putative methionine-R-sulfoxide reductase with GAF domain